eukprot:3448086-Rhodomonas_salina.1
MEADLHGRGRNRAFSHRVRSEAAGEEVHWASLRRVLAHISTGPGMKHPYRQPKKRAHGGIKDNIALCGTKRTGTAAYCN